MGDQKIRSKTIENLKGKTMQAAAKFSVIESDKKEISQVKDLAKKATKQGQQIAAIETYIAAHDPLKSLEVVRAFTQKVEALRALTSVMTLKAAVFSGLMMLARKDGDAAVLTVSNWFYVNEPAPDYAWSTIENKPLGDIYKMAIAGTDLR